MGNMMLMLVMTFWVKKSLSAQTAPLFIAINADHFGIRCLVKLDISVQTSIFVTECENRPK